MACSSLRWSTVICRISAFSSLDEPCGEKSATSHPVASDFIELVFVSCQGIGMNTLSLDLSARTCFSKALGTSLRSSVRLWLIRSLRLFSMIYNTSRGTVKAKKQWRENRLRASVTVHSPLFSSFGPEPARHCRETWTRWLGCTMEIQKRKLKKEERERWGRLRGEEGDMATLCCILLLLPSLIWHRGGMAHQPPSI